MADATLSGHPSGTETTTHHRISQKTPQLPTSIKPADQRAVPSSSPSASRTPQPSQEKQPSAAHPSQAHRPTPQQPQPQPQQQQQQQHQHSSQVTSISNLINPPQSDSQAGRSGDVVMRDVANSSGSQGTSRQNHTQSPTPQHTPHASHASSTSKTNKPTQNPSQQTVRPTKGKYSLNDFSLLRTLGTGSFGRVHLVQSRHNQRFYAIKVLKKEQVVKMKQVEHTNDERRMLQRVKHPFLVTLWGTFQDSKNLYMVMDFVEGGELFSLLRKSQVRATD